MTSRRKREPIDVELRLSRQMLEVIDALAKQGILGETREEVVLYIMRTYLFERSLMVVKASEPAVQNPPPRSANGLEPQF